MATTKTQRISIWAIAILMGVGTVGSFAMIVLQNSNAKRDDARVKELTAEYEAGKKKHDAEVAAKWLPVVSEYMSRAAEFNADDVTELGIEDLVVGEGEDINAESSFKAYYIGWTPDGNIFDSSIKDEVLVDPLDVTPGGLIEGFNKGVVGMKIGGIRELTIPAAQAYGEAGSPPSISPNTPLKFIVIAVPTPDGVSMPEELLNYYSTGRLQ